MPQANSTISMPRVTSPWASVKTLPCSAVIIAAGGVGLGAGSASSSARNARAAFALDEVGDVEQVRARGGSECAQSRKTRRLAPDPFCSNHCSRR
jgi:hypothetical protein